MAFSADQDTRRAREIEHQRRFQKSYRDSTPAWYRGEIHLAFTLAFTIGTIAFCASRIAQPTAWEWALFVPMFFVANWVEWASHRYILHRPVPGLKAVYKRHCGVHHQFFSAHDLTYDGHRDWRALLFPPFAPIAFVVASLPVAIVLGLLWSVNAAYLVVAQMAGYYLLYEALHTVSHLDEARHPYLRHVPVINTIRRMHRVHHEWGQMQSRNFNLTFPICDALFGTSDLNRGVIATLFNGASERHAKGDAGTPPPADLYGPLDAEGDNRERTA